MKPIMTEGVLARDKAADGGHVWVFVGASLNYVKYVKYGSWDQGIHNKQEQGWIAPVEQSWKWWDPRDFEDIYGKKNLPRFGTKELVDIEL